MATKAKAVAPPGGAMPHAGPWLSPPGTLEERLQRIEAMGQRVSGYVTSMCQVGSLGGSSTEAKERAVTAFYERMVTVEQQLRHIHEALQLE